MFKYGKVEIRKWFFCLYKKQEDWKILNDPGLILSDVMEGHFIQIRLQILRKPKGSKIPSTLTDEPNKIPLSCIKTV